MGFGQDGGGGECEAQGLPDEIQRLPAERPGVGPRRPGCRAYKGYTGLFRGDVRLYTG